MPAGYQYVDGIGSDVDQGVLRDRRSLAEEGFVVVIVTVDKASGEIVTGPEIVTRGWVYEAEAEELLDDARAAVRGLAGRRRQRRARPTSRRCGAMHGERSASSSTSAPGGARPSSRWSWRSDRPSFGVIWVGRVRVDGS